MMISCKHGELCLLEAHIFGGFYIDKKHWKLSSFLQRFQNFKYLWEGLYANRCLIFSVAHIIQCPEDVFSFLNI